MAKKLVFDGTFIEPNELKRRVLRYKGPVAKYRPKPGTEKSTKIRIWDIERLAGLYKLHLFDWLYGTRNFGAVRLRRVSRIIELCDAGMITKAQYGVYQFHDKPVGQPMREMKLSLDAKGIKLGQAPKVEPKKEMPSFNQIFGVLKCR